MSSFIPFCATSSSLVPYFEVLGHVRRRDRPRARACTHAFTFTHIHTHSDSRARSCTNSHTHTNTHTRAHIDAHIHIQTPTHTHEYPYAHCIHIHVRRHRHIHAFSHSHRHNTHTTQTHIHPSQKHKHHIVCRVTDAPPRPATSGTLLAMSASCRGVLPARCKRLAPPTSPMTSCFRLRPLHLPPGGEGRGGFCQRCCRFSLRRFSFLFRCRR